eukprot:6466694-Amphidinium_carterae.2
MECTVTSHGQQQLRQSDSLTMSHSIEACLSCLLLRVLMMLVVSSESVIECAQPAKLAQRCDVRRIHFLGAAEFAL